MSYQELSQRVGKLTDTSTFKALAPSTRAELAGEVSDVEEFDELPEWVQLTITEAEAEAATG